LSDGSQGSVAGMLARLRGGQLNNSVSTAIWDERYFSPPKI
jgi:hypothetical protein